MNKNCFACMTPSNPKSNKRMRNKSFFQRKTKKSDSIVLVPRNTTTDQRLYDWTYDFFEFIKHSNTF